MAEGHIPEGFHAIGQGDGKKPCAVVKGAVANGHKSRTKVNFGKGGATLKRLCAKRGDRRGEFHGHKPCAIGEGLRTDVGKQRSIGGIKRRERGTTGKGTGTDRFKLRARGEHDLGKRGTARKRARTDGGQVLAECDGFKGGTAREGIGEQFTDGGRKRDGFQRGTARERACINNLNRVRQGDADDTGIPCKGIRGNTSHTQTAVHGGDLNMGIVALIAGYIIEGRILGQGELDLACLHGQGAGGTYPVGLGGDRCRTNRLGDNHASTVHGSNSLVRRAPCDGGIGGVRGCNRRAQGEGLTDIHLGCGDRKRHARNRNTQGLAMCEGFTSLRTAMAGIVIDGGGIDRSIRKLVSIGNHFFGVSVACRRDSGLRGKHRLTDRAMATRSQTGFGTGRSYRRIGDSGVPERGLLGIGRVVTARAGHIGIVADCRTGGRFSTVGDLIVTERGNGFLSHKNHLAHRAMTAFGQACINAGRSNRRVDYRGVHMRCSRRRGRGSDGCRGSGSIRIISATGGKRRKANGNQSQKKEYM